MIKELFLAFSFFCLKLSLFCMAFVCIILTSFTQAFYTALLSLKDATKDLYIRFILDY